MPPDSAPPPSTADDVDAADLRARLGDLSVADERRLRRRLREALSTGDAAVRQGALGQVAREIAAGQARVARRRAAVPAVRLPAELPITERADDILDALRRHQVVVVAGETGSGKSTQLPKLCLALGKGVRGMIGHTQPRRLAARAVAERVAEELGSEVGSAVGYAVRFTDRVGEDTLVKVMTDGILLTEIQRDRLLTRYDTIIVDEAHERSLNVDFILGYLKQLLPRRPDLTVVVTSATIDTDRFSRHFEDAPVIEVSGRTHPVEVRYRPFGDAAPGGGDDRDQVQAICDAVDELGREAPGDVLVFLSGEREIRDTADALVKLGRRDLEVLPLYARLSAAEQHRVFEPHQGRRVVLATNVAETSLTVPGIRAVVDPGTARISRYSRRTKVQRLPIEPVSRASANQRAGRCGRVGPGVCVRLYPEDDFLARPDFTDPEILRTNLASVILQMAALGLGDVAAFPFVDPPDARSIADGVALLEELGALHPGEEDGGDGAARSRGVRLTALGRRLARLPVDPRLGRMVLEAEHHGCVHEVMVMAAALSIQDPRERPAGKEQAAAEQHARFADDDSDFFSYLRLWDHLQEQQDALSSSQFRKLCRAEFLNYLRIREWQDIYAQLHQVVRALGIAVNREPADRDAVHISLLAGLLSHVGLRAGDTREYQGARHARFAIAPGSAVARKPPRWVMAAELVETNRLWARVAARIQPEWVERVGAHLVKRSYGEPWWDTRRAAAMTAERVTLYGLPVVPSRPVPYGRVDPPAARDLFIQHALVEGDWATHHPFFSENHRLVEEVGALEERTRRGGILVDDDTLFRFFDERVGSEVVSGRHFDQWWKQARKADPRLLSYTRELLVRPDAGGVDAEDYPDVWRQGDIALAVTYSFDPGSDSDGVTVHVPLPLLNQTSADGFDWQVPGLREELVTELIRSLPKAIRRSFVPAPDYARAVLQRVTPGDGPLLDVLTRELPRLSGDPLPAGSFDLDRVPSHLRVTFSVEDGDGHVVATGFDLDELTRRLRGDMRRAVAAPSVGPAGAPQVEHAGARTWVFGAVPRRVATPWGDHTVVAHPALVDQGDSVGVRLLPTEDEQARAMRRGTRRLLLLTLPSPAGDLRRSLPPEVMLALASAPHASAADLFADCIDAAVDHLVAEHGGPAWDESGFAALRDHVASRLGPTAVDTGRQVGQILVGRQRILARLDALTAPVFDAAVVDIRGHLARLVHSGFVTATGTVRLPDVVRYLQAVDRRIDRLVADPARDLALLRRVRVLEQEYADVLAQLPPEATPRELADIRWMLEELRVGLFAQSVGTKHPVSEKRVLRELDRIAPRA